MSLPSDLERCLKTLALTLFLTPALWFLLTRQETQRWIARRRLGIRLVFKVCCFAIIVLTVVCGLSAVMTEHMRFHDEATVLSIAAAFRHGQPMYPPNAGPAEYGLLYGPMTYFVYLPPMLLGAERLGWYQGWVLVALAASLFFIYLALRRIGSGFAVLACVTYVAMFAARFADSTWAIKGDVWILLFSAVGFWAALSLDSWTAALVVGFAGAVLVDLKITLALLALLPCVTLWQRGRGSRSWAMAGAVLIPLFASVPFLFHRISLAAYREQLVEAAGHGLSKAHLLENLFTLLQMFLPTLALLWWLQGAPSGRAREFYQRRRVFLLMLVAASCVACVTGAKVGAGSWHCLVLLMPLAILNAEIWNSAVPAGREEFGVAAQWSAPLLSVGLILMALTFPVLRADMQRRYHDPNESISFSMPSAERDLIQIVDGHAGFTLQMGYSDGPHYPLSFIRPLLQMRKSPLLIDADVRNESDLARRPMSPATIEAVKGCAIGVWIVPKGGAPFSMESPYFAEGSSPVRDLFPESFRSAFFQSYQKEESSSTFYDLWSCKKSF